MSPSCPRAPSLYSPFNLFKFELCWRSTQSLWFTWTSIKQFSSRTLVSGHTIFSLEIVECARKYNREGFIDRGSRTSYLPSRARWIPPKKKTKRLWSKTTWHLAVKGRNRRISPYDIPAKPVLRSWWSKFRLRAILSGERGEQRENVRASIAARSGEVAFPFACHLRVTYHDDGDLIDLAKGV